MALAHVTVPARPAGRAKIVRALPDPKRALIYARVSTHPQGKHGYGLDTQLKECRALAERERLTVVEVIQDVDSGADWELPGLHRLLDLAERGEFGTAVIYDPDRLSRSLSKYVWLDTQLTAAGVRAHYVTVGTATTDDDKAFHEIKAVFAQLDYKRIIRRLSAGKREKVSRGLVAGLGVAPYGYRYLRDDRGKHCALEVDEARAVIVRRIFRDAARMSLMHLCDGLNADDIPTMRPKRASAGWTPSTVQGILHNPAYRGQVAYGRRAGKDRMPVHDRSQWLYSPAPAIVTQEEWDAAHAALIYRQQARSARTPRTDAAFLLRSLVRCAHCGGPLRCETNSGVRYYLCGRSKPMQAARRGLAVCPLPAVPAAGLERLAWEDVAATLLDPERLSAGLAAARAKYEQANGRRTEQLAVLERKIGALRARLSRILDEQLEAPPESERARLYGEKGRQIEMELEHLQTDRDRLGELPHAGLTEAEVLSLTEFAAEVRTGLGVATSDERRRVVELLQIRGAVRLDQDGGIRLGHKNRFAFEWTSVIPLRRSEREFVNIQTIVVSDGTNPAHMVGRAPAAQAPVPTE
jgi:site-specific DNA recombinase